jgi:phosphoribosyl-AMP cyclohydrolase / phosphoribosyl-ATP pyrophosphohydrolase
VPESQTVLPDLANVAFDDRGLVTAVVQHHESGEVLMVGWMNAEALAGTVRSGLVTFHSRSRGRLWTKGETSGNVLRLKGMRLDCDGDTLLVLAEPAGPVCHTGNVTCFAGRDLDLSAGLVNA